jgi:hypothetical protein
VDGETTLDVVEETEVLAGFLDGDDVWGSVENAASGGRLKHQAWQRGRESEPSGYLRNGPAEIGQSQI